MVISVIKNGDNCIIKYSKTELVIENNKVKNTEIYEIFKDLSINEIRNITFADVNNTVSEAEQSLLNEIIDILKRIREKIVESENE